MLQNAIYARRLAGSVSAFLPLLERQHAIHPLDEA